MGFLFQMVDYVVTVWQILISVSDGRLCRHCLADTYFCFRWSTMLSLFDRYLFLFQMVDYVVTVWQILISVSDGRLCRHCLTDTCSCFRWSTMLSLFGRY